MASSGFAKIGATFNDATTLLVGGVWNTVNSGGNADHLLTDFATVQGELHDLMTANPGQFQGLTGIHAQTIFNQLTLELGALNELMHASNVGQPSSGTVFGSRFAGKAINDIHRDIIDIVQADQNLHAIATE